MEKKREIKFRYWNGVSSIMVNDPKIPYKEGWTVEQLFSDRGWVWMQYTGLKDINNKDIYEGDIVRIGNELIEVMEWVTPDRWNAEECPVNGWVNHESIYGEKPEVIGNIYENPELISKLNKE